MRNAAPYLFVKYIPSRYVLFAAFKGGFFACALLATVLLLAPAAGAASMGSTKAPSPTASAANPYTIHSWQWTLFNATASFLGLPGLVSPTGEVDEGLGFHADGTTRRADGSTDSSARFGGQRASSYLRSGLGVLQGPWLNDDLMGFSRDAQGRLVRLGDEYSGRRSDGRSYGSTLFGNGDGMFGASLLQRGISAGMGFANSAVESSILGLMGKDSPYGNGKARLNFMWYLDKNGKSRFGGEGDVLWPLYDSLYTTIYTQFGARSIYGGGENYAPTAG